MRNTLYRSAVRGGSVTLVGPDSLAVEVYFKSSGMNAALDRDDVDRLLAVRETSVDPVVDIAEFFDNVFATGWVDAIRMAEMFVASAPEITQAFDL